MNHKPFVDHMHAALDGDLALADRNELTEHLNTCADCQTLWDALNETQRRFRAEPLATPRPGFTGRFRARLQAQRARPPVVWGALALGFGAISAAAIVLPLGLNFLASGWHLASQPATLTALYSCLTTLADLVTILLEVLLVFFRALAEIALAHPLTGPLSMSALSVVILWFYLLRKLKPEVVLR
jgi:anti-sigma factor RsiW